MTMTDHAKDYVASKKALGLSFRGQERVLMRYAEHADARGDKFVRTNSVLDWAGTAASVREAQRQLRIVRGMAVFLHVEDDRHEVPHRDALGKPRRYRPPPYIPSPEEIRKIMTEALSLPPAGSLTPLTFHFIIGLMACTGLRRSEAAGLLLSDLGPDGLLVRNTKNRRDRLVPLHESTRRALDDYLVAGETTAATGVFGTAIKLCVTPGLRGNVVLAGQRQIPIELYGRLLARRQAPHGPPLLKCFAPCGIRPALPGRRTPRARERNQPPGPGDQSRKSTNPPRRADTSVTLPGKCHRGIRPGHDGNNATGETASAMFRKRKRY